MRNIRYSNAADADPVKNTLNLFLPKGSNFPTLIFVHGGSWHEGDKDLKVGGADVYSNIGRYFASQGIATAVISYRLIPKVGWRTQVQDIAAATAWVYRHISEYHGNPNALYITGHSAGAQLASRIALDSGPLKALGLSPNLLCGVIPISGVGYNFLSDEEYQLGKDDDLYQKLFNQEDISTQQKKKMSPILFAKKSAPAFLVLYAKGEQKEIRHASEDFHGWLKSVGTESQLYEIPNVGHKSEILALSRPKGPAIATLIFIRTSDCEK